MSGFQALVVSSGFLLSRGEPRLRSHYCDRQVPIKMLSQGRGGKQAGRNAAQHRIPALQLLLVTASVAQLPRVACRTSLAAAATTANERHTTAVANWEYRPILHPPHQPTLLLNYCQPVTTCLPTFLSKAELHGGCCGRQVTALRQPPSSNYPHQPRLTW